MLLMCQGYRVGAGVVGMRGGGPCGRPLSGGWQGCSPNNGATTGGHKGHPHTSSLPPPLREPAFQASWQNTYRAYYAFSLPSFSLSWALVNVCKGYVKSMFLSTLLSCSRRQCGGILLIPIICVAT